jgi:hypothetical protein
MNTWPPTQPPLNEDLCANCDNPVAYIIHRFEVPTDLFLCSRCYVAFSWGLYHSDRIITTEYIGVSSKKVPQKTEGSGA